MNLMAQRWARLYPGTTAELALEDAVAALGIPYRTQFPGFLFGTRFYPDFFLPTVGLVIEVDDPSHGKKAVEDAERTEALYRAWGVRVIRITNEAALGDPFGSLKAALESVGMWPVRSTRKLAESLPRRGGPKPSTRSTSHPFATPGRKSTRKP